MESDGPNTEARSHPITPSSKAKHSGETNLRMPDDSSANIQLIASKTGYSKATVSRVLRNQPGHSVKTREKILKVAEEMNFSLNPIMSAVMSNVRFKKSSNFSPVIAQVHCQPWNRKRGWNMEALREKIREQATQLGFTVEEFNWFDPEMKPKRLLQILEARGIRGVILEHFMESDVKLDIDFSNFSVVSIGGTLQQPRFHRIEVNHYSAVLNAVSILRKRGYRRCGLAIPALFEKLSDFKREAALYIANRALPQEDQIPIYFIDEEATFEGFKEWIDTYSPECVLGAGRAVSRKLESLGYTFPDKMGFVHLGWHSSYTGLAGMNPNWGEIGIAAVNLVADQLSRNESGVPRHGLWVLIESEWVEGPSVRPPAPSETSETASGSESPALV
ncbi:MAG: LacI family DNA-binding transcriptional regulator [Verrucomicrobiota bacterium]